MADIAFASPLNPRSGVVVTPPGMIRSAIKLEVDRALADIPKDKNGAMVAVATPAGVNLAIAAKTGNGWEVVGWIGKSWAAGSKIDYGAQVKKTWLLIPFLLALASPASAQPSWLVDGANGAALVAHSADLASTIRCTVGETCQEANAILRPFVGGPDPKPQAFFALKMGTAFGSFLLKTRLKADHPRWVVGVSVAETVAFFAIAAHNNRVHERARR